MRFEKTDYFYKIPKNNVIPELITDVLYTALNSYGMIHNVRLRNYLIRREFNILKQGFNKREAFDILANDFSIKRNTLRKITHNQRNIKRT